MERRPGRGVLEIAHRHNIPEAALRELAGWQLQQEQALVRVATESARRDLQEGQRVLRKNGATSTMRISSSRSRPPRWPGSIRARCRALPTRRR